MDLRSGSRRAEEGCGTQPAAGWTGGEIALPPRRGSRLTSILAVMTAPGEIEPQRTTGDVVTMDKIVALSKRRGFVFPSSEIYRGGGSPYHVSPFRGPPQNNVKNELWPAP